MPRALTLLSLLKKDRKIQREGEREGGRREGGKERRKEGRENGELYTEITLTTHNPMCTNSPTIFLS